MEDKLVPAHVLFTRWFIRIRWVALIILIIANLVVKHIFNLTIQERAIYILAFVLFTLNFLHTLILNRITGQGGNKVIYKIKQAIHFQIITDLIVLTFILHYSGGIENPVFLFYFFHMIIASSIFSSFQSYLHTTFALLMAAMLAFFECYSIIPHHHLANFVDPDLYRNTFFISGAGFIFVCTSIMIVSLSHMIISRSIKSEESYARNNIELENKDKLKNEYVLRVTHDIKGHLAAILSCLEVIRSQKTGTLNALQEEFTRRAYERTELLTAFVKDLLNLTKKRLKHDQEFEEFLLKDLVNKVVAPVRILASDKNIDFNISVDPAIHSINGDPFAIEELYSNLLLNAIKYTSAKGHVSLTIHNRPDHIITEIADSGIGIPTAELSKIFDEFYRASNVPKETKGGSGLGLSIVKQIIENHKGKIWVRSEPGVWTNFTFTLPKNPGLIS